MDGVDFSQADGVAVIGMSGRFPGARDVNQFWRNLCDGVCGITRFDDSELEDVFPRAVRDGENFVRARGILDDIDQFDAGFFGLQAREAALTDPQHRIFLECAWEALEAAGYDPAAYRGAIGVFAGASLPSYFLRHVAPDRDAIDVFTSDYQVGSYPALLGMLPDFLATRVAYKLDLRGPAVNVQSACSTSLVAVAQACQSLKLYESDMALAGGVSITLPQKRGALHQDGGMASADGRCRTFDAAASGTVFGSGAGVVLLKRLADALKDGDEIHAVILGAATNNDGAAKVGFTAPSVSGQEAVIRAAHDMAGVSADTISYVECHGTATPLGDPIEFAALTAAFSGSGKTGFCTLGSAKPYVGHLDVAAGITGLIKTVLSLKHAKLPGMLHYTTPNPGIALDGSPFTITAALAGWESGVHPRRAGVSAFGVGGTNAHVVLEEAPGCVPAAGRKPRQLIVLSARSEAALATTQLRLADHLRAAPELDLADVAFTLQAGRRRFAHRLAFTAGGREEVLSRLAEAKPSGSPSRDRRVVFMFPGQGSQHPGMARSLLRQEPVFAEAIDRCAACLAGPLGLDLRSLLNAAPDDQDAASRLRDTLLAQPAIFAVEYALAKLWIAWGVRPAAMIGHSVGEFVAACLAGVMSLEDALSVVAARGRLLQAQPGGAMLAVRLPEAALRPLLDGASLAAVNAPSLCVAAGPHDSIAALEAVLAAQGAGFRRLHTSHAFHSPMMDPAIAPLTEIVAGIALHPPNIPYVSCVTGDWIRDDEAISPKYWGRHCRETVRFAGGLARIVANEAPILLEVGPGRTLASLASQGAGRSSVVVASLPDAQSDQSDDDSLLQALGKLAVAGVEPDWASVHAPWTPRRVSLPTIVFERARHWLERPPAEPGRLIENSAISPKLAEASSEFFSNDMEVMTQVSAAPPEASNNEAAKSRLRATLIGLLEGVSGEDLSQTDPNTSFLELGFDSLLLGQVSQLLQSRFGVQIAFRELLGDLPSVAALTDHLLRVLPPEPEAQAAVAPAVASRPGPQNAIEAETGSVIERVMRDQLRAMQELIDRQLAALGGRSQIAAPQAIDTPAPARPPATAADPVSRINVYTPQAANATDPLSQAQRAHLDAFAARYAARTAGSKHFTQQNRAHLADPRAAAGFRAEWKDIVYPIVVSRSKGARLWDVDGNEYVDLVNGFGQTAFGHAPDFVVEAVKAQLDVGFAIGPQTELAGEVAALFCDMTGNARATFCNTGSEAVMAAMRVARAVTGRRLIVIFAGDYHGQFDEVLVKGARTGQPRALPAAPGIPAESVGSMVVLNYGDPQSLAWIAANAEKLAAVVIEPVQSRHPELRPEAWVRELRAITEKSGTALVVDEVVTGFRVGLAGMQGLWNIRGDMATYGKVVGGGMPIGVLAGTPRFMDALDGGMWHYGDDSIPEVAPTFFAGTFVRHPLALAAARAVLLHLRDDGASMLDALSARAAGLASRVNGAFASRGLAARAETFSSWFYLNAPQDGRFATLIWHHLRDRGIHAQEGYPCFLTTAHTDADIDTIAAAFDSGLDEMLEGGLLTPKPPAPRAATGSGDEIPPPAAAVIEVRLTEPQREIWLSAQLGDAASCAFNESVSIAFEGHLDAEALAGALGDVIARHESLRARFGETGEHMLIDPRLELRLEKSDCSDDPHALQNLVLEDARTPFDLANGPLLRARLVRLAEAQHVLVFTAHHIVCDGYSIGVICDEMASRYAARLGLERSALGKIVKFSDYAIAQETRPEAELARIEDFWLQRFAHPAPALDLPVDRPRPPRKSFHGATYKTEIDVGLYQAVRKAGGRQGCTFFVTLLGAFQLLLGRLSGQDDVVVGIPSAGQSQIESGVLVGHCVNFLPLRATWDDATTLTGFLQSVRQTVLEAYEHQGTTLGTLVRKLALPQEPGRIKLVEAQFNLERLGGRMSLPGLRMNLSANPKLFVNFDIFLNIVESPQGLRLEVDYNTDLFDEATIARWMNHYRSLLAAFVQTDAETAATLKLLSHDERDAILAGLRGPAVIHPVAKTVDELIAAQAALRPNSIAAACGAGSLTYRGLDLRANQLAHRLRGLAGATPCRIGILLDRSLDILVSLLAVFKAGHAYVPLDPTHPAARLRLILEEAGASCVIAGDEVLLEAIPEGVPILFPGRDASSIAAEPETAPSAAAPGRAAYVIYTSGSTGRPKGVEIGQSALVNVLLSMREAPGFSADEILLAVTTISFDIAGLELFLPLIAGGKVVIATQADCADPPALLGLLASTGATMMQATPSLWRVLLESGLMPHAGLRLLCGGEALKRDLADRLLAGGAALWNMYGPTETTIWSACGRVAPGDGAIGIGAPVANTSLYVLDRHDRVVPPGVAGELHIAGDGLATRYVGQPELTAAAFRDVAIEGQAAQRLYRTGDRARVDASGAVNLLGRLDSQIKLRGFRIEIGEIEAVLSRIPSLSASAVRLVTEASGTARLAGYYVERAGQTAAPAALARLLAEQLPDYMIPSIWMRLDSLPMTANGKLDRGALPMPNHGATPDARAAPFMAPRTAMETTLAAIWAEVLGRGPIGIHDDLFHLGADSIQIFQIAARMARAGLPFAARHLMQHPAIADLAALAPASRAPEAVPSLRQFARARPS